MAKKGETITIKSTKNGLEFWVDEGTPYSVVSDTLFENLNANKRFYTGTTMPASFFGKRFTSIQKRELSGILREDYGIASVHFPDDEDIAAPLHEEGEALAPAAKKQQVKKEGNADSRNVFYIGTVRSGQRIESEGDVTIIGDVNAGAEIVAGGNIAIFGKLRGLVHAGARGRQDIIIAANYLMPQQVRIGGKIALIPQDRLLEGPEMVKIVDGKIVVDLLG